MSSEKITTSFSRGLGFAWLAMSLTLALHVLDEALNDFLSVYNPNAAWLKNMAPFLPIPTFTFSTWIIGLVIAVVLIALFSIYAFRSKYWMKPLSYGLGFLMLMNGLAHIASSLYFSRWMPGVYSSPLLLISSIYMLTSARRFVRT